MNRLLFLSPLALAASLQAAVEVRTGEELNAAIASGADRYVVFMADIMVPGGGLHALHPGAPWLIEGNGFSLDGGNVRSGFSIFEVDVHFRNLTIRNTKARGGDGGRAQLVPFLAQDGSLQYYGAGGGGGGMGGQGGDGYLVIQNNAVSAWEGGGGGGWGATAYGGTLPGFNNGGRGVLNFTGSYDLTKGDGGRAGLGGSLSDGKFFETLFFQGSNPADDGGYGGYAGFCGGGGGGTGQSHVFDQVGKPAGLGGGGGFGGSTGGSAVQRGRPAEGSGFGAGAPGGSEGAGFGGGHGAGGELVGDTMVWNGVGAGTGGGGLGAGGAIFAARRLDVFNPAPDNVPEVTFENVNFLFTQAVGGNGGTPTNPLTLPGGGGAGLGGAVFLMGAPTSTSPLHVINVIGGASQVGGTVIGGKAKPHYPATEQELIDFGGESQGGEAGDGQAMGSGYFLYGFGSLRLAPDCDQTILVSGSICDEAASGLAGAGGTGGEWDVVIREPSEGMVEFQSENFYTGQTEVFGGKLRLSGGGDLGEGELRIKPEGTLEVANTLNMENDVLVLGGGNFVIEKAGAIHMGAHTIDDLTTMSFVFELGANGEAGLLTTASIALDGRLFAGATDLGTKLKLRVVDGGPSAGDVTKIIEASNSLTGIFNGIPEGSVVWSDGFLETTISYENTAVTLTTVALPVLTVSGDNFDQLVAQSNASEEKEVIFLNGASVLLDDEAVLTKDVNIMGPGTISGNGASRLLRIERDFGLEGPVFGTRVWLDQISFLDGQAQPGDTLDFGSGGAILSNGDLRVTRSTFFANQAADGAPATEDGMTGGFGSHGGAIASYGRLVVENSTFVGNRAGFGGMSINSDVADQGTGGAIFSGGYLELINCTITGNRAGSGEFGSSSDRRVAGGVWTEADGRPQVRNCIILGNEGYRRGELEGTIKPSDLAGFDIQTGPNLIGFSNGNGFDGTEYFSVDEIDTVFVLDEDGTALLADNGGPTLTVALSPLSVAADQGDAAFVKAGTDQRGLARVENGAPDFGALEVQMPVLFDYESTILAQGATDYWRMSNVMESRWEPNLGRLGGAPGRYEGTVKSVVGLLPNEASGKGLSLKANDDRARLSAPRPGVLAVSTAVSLSLWFQLNAPASGFNSTHNLVGNRIRNDDYSFMLSLRNDFGGGYRLAPHVWTEGNANFWSNSIQPISEGVLYHAVMTWDSASNSIGLFLNGVPFALGQTTDPRLGGVLRARDNPLYVGRDGKEAALPGGWKVDEVALFDRVLTPDEIAAQYEVGIKNRELLEDLSSDGIPSFFEVMNGLDPAVDNTGLDPDGDGMTVLEEFVFGGSARSVEQMSDFVQLSPESEGNEQFLEINYRLNPLAAPYVRIEPLRSTGLSAGGWSANEFGPMTLERMPDGSQRVRCRSMVPIGDQEREFIRLGISPK